MKTEYNFEQPVDRAGTNCIKWDRRKGKFQEEDVLPMWIADTDFSCPKEVMEALSDRIAHPIFGYSFPDETYFSSIIDWFGSRHGLKIQKEWIRSCCGVVTAVSYCIQALTSPGDQVLIQPPVYDPFQAVITGTGRKVVENPLISKDGSYEMDYEGLERAFGSGVRLMVLCNPHNPVGRVWTRDELKTLIDLCIQYHVYLVSDEIHCDMELFNNHYTSVLQFPESHEIAVSCISPGKTFNISGLAVSATLIPHKELNEKVGDKLRSAWLINPCVLSLKASAAAYTYGGPWLDAQIAHLEQNSLAVQNRLAQEAPHIRTSRHEGTFLMWLDFSDFGLSDKELEEELSHTWHLGFNSGFHFGTGGSGFMRMNIGCTGAVIHQALDRLVQMHQAHFGSHTPPRAD